MRKFIVKPIAFILLALFSLSIFFQACKKDRNNAPESFNNDRQLIKQDAIMEWLKVNPSSDLLTPDWAKAKQGIINGRFAIKVPLLSSTERLSRVYKSTIDKMKANNEIMIDKNSNVNPNYHSELPPTLYLIQEKDKSIHGHVFNFLPDPNHMPGNVNGTLFEWVMSDNSLKEIGVTDNKQTSITNYSQKSGSLQNYVEMSKQAGLGGLKDKTVSPSFFKWLFRQIELFIGWIGSLIGVTIWVAPSELSGPGHYERVLGGDTSNIGNDGNGGSSGSSGWPFYGDYMPVYNSSLNPDGAIISPYPYTGGPIPARTIADDLIQVADVVDIDVINWLGDHDEIAEALFEYSNAVGWDLTTQQHFQWSVNYLYNNQSVTIEVFKNQFLSPPPGKDYDGFDEDYWTDPNLYFTTQNLPTYANFSTNYPSPKDVLYKTSADIYNSVGGQLAAFNTEANSCAIRVSKALNYSGVTIPSITGKTWKGADNKYYFIRAADLNQWMRKTFGTNDGDPLTPYNANHYRYNQTQAGVEGVNLPTLLAGKKGIYSMLSSRASWATGHADVLKSTSECIGDCHFDGPIKFLDIWVLQ